MTFPGREIMKDGAEAAKAKVAALSDQELAGLLKSSVQIVENDRRENQLCYYQPVSPKVVRYHAAAERTVAMFGGNGCIPLTEPVLMADGSWKPLGDIKVG